MVKEPLLAKRRLLYIPEQIALYGELSGLENLEYFAALAGVGDLHPERLKTCSSTRASPRRRSRGVLPRTQSSMRQKVGVALAIAKQARALLLDEPTSGLDPQASVEFHDLVRRQRDGGAAVLMATHDLFRAREIADRIGLMREGKLRRALRAADITANGLEALYPEEMGVQRQRN